MSMANSMNAHTGKVWFITGASTGFGRLLAEQVLKAGGRVIATARNAGGIAELVEHGQLDLVLHIDDGLLPSHFQSERLYREDWICAVARESQFGDELSLKRYVAASHIIVSTYGGVQTIPDKQLAAVGAKRRSCIRVPYFGVALQCLPGTELVLTLTSGMTSVVKSDRKLRLVKAPQELHSFHFLMAWHPRLNTDPRHVWLREAMRSTTGALSR